MHHEKQFEKEFKAKCLNLTQKLINQSFPELKEKKIYVFMLNSKFYSNSIWIPFFIRFISISKNSLKFNDFCLQGLLAHELCHQERYLEMKFIKYIKFSFYYLFSDKFRTIEEKSVDKLTTQKGYGKQLYELSVIQFQDKKRNGINKYYSSLEEIKSYAKENGTSF